MSKVGLRGDPEGTWSPIPPNGEVNTDQLYTQAGWRMDDVTAALEEIRQQHYQRLDYHSGEVRTIRREIARIEKAMSALGVTFQETDEQAKRKKQSPNRIGISEEKLARVEGAIREYARDHEEFRQVDIRALLDDVNSSLAAIAFEQLRRRNVIRFARKEGNAKWFRLFNQEVSKDV